MLFNPLRTLSIILVRRIFNILGIPKNVFTFSYSLFSVIIPLLPTVGIIPVVKVLRRLNDVIRNNQPLSMLRVLYGNELNPYITSIIISAIDPYFKDCYKFNKFYITYKWLILPMLLISSLRFVTFKILRISFGLLLS